VLSATPTYGTGFARNAAESKAPHLWRGLIGLWAPFLGATGNTLRDWSGNNNHGTILGATWGPGENGAALSFLEADNDIVNLGTTLFRTLHNFTAIVKTRPGADTSRDPTCCWSTANNTSSASPMMGVGWSAYNMRLRVYMKGTQVNSGGLLLTRHKWQTVAMVYIVGTSIKIYIDGVLFYTDTVFTDYDLITDGATALGAHKRTGSLTYTGDQDIEYGYIYNRALTASEVMFQYRNEYMMLEEARVPLWHVTAEEEAGYIPRILSVA